MQLWTAGPTAAPKIIGLPGHGGVGNRLLRKSIQDIPGVTQGKPISTNIFNVMVEVVIRRGGGGRRSGRI